MPFLLCAACSHKSGTLVTRDRGELTGYIRFENCYNRYKDDSSGQREVGEQNVEYKSSRISFSENLPLSTIRQIRTEDGEYAVRNVVKSQYGDEVQGFVPVQPVITGKASLYRACSVHYSSTMFQSTRLDLLVDLVAVSPDENLYTLDAEPKRVKKFFQEHFAACRSLVTEIAKMKSVESADLPELVGKYNRCVGTTTP